MTRRCAEDVWAVIPTFRRSAWLARTLESLESQTVLPRSVMVIDNESSELTAELVRGFAARCPEVRVEYLDPESNVGPAGATCLAMVDAVEHGPPDGWVLRLDDDRPLTRRDQIAELLRVCNRALALTPDVGGVGLGGSRFDWRRGRLTKPPLERAGEGLVRVDFLSTNQLPMFRLEAIRAVGPFDASLFFGFSEVEFGLRMRRAGYVLLRADLWAGERTPSKARLRLSEPGWRRYYSLRNQIVVLRRYGYTTTAVRISLVRGIGKPIANLPRSPRRAMRALRQNLRATWDGWRGNLGRTVDPMDWLGHEDDLPPT